MAKTIAEKTIERIIIIDDNEEFRSGLEDTVQESQFMAFSQDDKVEDIDVFLQNNIQKDDAIITDHQLKIKNYFPVNGAELVSRCYTINTPAVLVTRYETHIDQIRKFRRNIPVIINPENFEPDTLIKGLEICIKELNGDFKPDRKGWRTLVRIDSLDDNHLYLIIPSWNCNDVISINRSDLPENINRIIHPDMRLHAQINIGSENSNDLYFSNWEIK